MLGNLLNNAAKYTNPGRHDQLLTTRARRRTSRSACSDTGIGIAPEALPKLFKLFSRVHDGRLTQAPRRTRHRSRAGAASSSSCTAARSASRARVAVRAASSSCGCRCMQRAPTALPYAASAHGRRSRADRSTAHADRGRQRDALDSLAMLLQMRRPRSAQGADGAEAFAAGSEWRPDVALLDIGMPDSMATKSRGASAPRPGART